MKTIAELNEKWYWRFIKVFFFFIIFISIIGIFAGAYDMYHTYNPKDVKIVEERFENFKEKFNHIKILDKKLKDTYPNFSIENLIQITNDLKLSKKIPYYLPLMILSEYPNANLDRIGMVCSQGKYSCDIKYDKDIDYYENYISQDTWIMVPKHEIDNFKNDGSFNDIKEIISFYDSYKSGNKDYYNLMKYYNNIDYGWKSYFPYEYFSEYDYRGLNEWIKIIFSFIGFIFLFFLFLFLIRGITYYIILGNFNPKN